MQNLGHLTSDCLLEGAFLASYSWLLFIYCYLYAIAVITLRYIICFVSCETFIPVWMKNLRGRFGLWLPFWEFWYSSIPVACWCSLKSAKQILSIFPAPETCVRKSPGVILILLYYARVDKFCVGTQLRANWFQLGLFRREIIVVNYSTWSFTADVMDLKL